MAEDNNPERVWDLIEKIRFCMLATNDGKDIRSRPMTAHAERGESAHGRHEDEGFAQGHRSTVLCIGSDSMRSGTGPDRTGGEETVCRAPPAVVHRTVSSRSRKSQEHGGLPGIFFAESPLRRANVRQGAQARLDTLGR